MLDQRRAIAGFQTVSAQLVRHRRADHHVPPRPAHLYRHKNDRAILGAGGRRAVPDAHQTDLQVSDMAPGTPIAPVASAYIASEERPEDASRRTRDASAAGASTSPQLFHRSIVSQALRCLAGRGLEGTHDAHPQPPAPESREHAASGFFRGFRRPLRRAATRGTGCGVAS
jgi:hypothetical protein